MKKSTSHSRQPQVIVEWLSPAKEVNMKHKGVGVNFTIFYPPASEASREVDNLTERKNLHTPVYGVKECLSVVNFDPNYTFVFLCSFFSLYFLGSLQLDYSI